jgi:hypothetical protein
MAYQYIIFDAANPERAGTVEWIGPPSENPALQANGQLGEMCGEQRVAAIGQPIPIVFARRVGDRGGVMIAPAATDARFEDTGEVTLSMDVSYHLILGDGPMGGVQVRDVYQCGCRVGEFTQTYNRRAGDWRPGNLLSESGLLALFSSSKPPYPPIYCGSVGTCKGISTFSWTRAFLAQDKDWRRQILIFIRDGRTVTRLADDVEGPSSNFADLYKLSLESLTKVPADMIDTARLQTAALFLDAQELYCDINITQSQSLGDFVGKNAPYFLLRETKVAGKRGLRPLLPIDSSYAIRTDPIPWEFEFTEDFIIPGSIEITHTPLEERKPKLLVALWRQQDDQSFGVIRSAEVGYQIDRDSGIVEQHDMSAFCTHEIHAVRAMAYKKAFRKWSSHTIAWACRPEVYNQILEEGDIVRLTFQRNASDGSVSTHDYLYTIEQINKSVTGEVLFVGSHFPVDAEGRSLIALTVMGAETQGEAYEVIQTGQVCDDGPYGGGGTPRVDDPGVPAEVSQEIETGEPPGPPSLPPVEVDEGDPPILPPASDEQPPPAPQPVLPPAPFPPGNPPDEPPPEPPPGGYPPPPVPPAPIPTPPDDPVDPCEPICTSVSICGEVGEPAPTCPAGTTQVGIITAHQPDGDQTCVICEDCEPVEDLNCYDCCPPESLALGYRCVPVWEHRLWLVSPNFVYSIRRSTSPTFTWGPGVNPNTLSATATSAIPTGTLSSCHTPEQTVTLFTVPTPDFSNYYVVTTYLGEECRSACP